MPVALPVSCNNCDKTAAGLRCGRCQRAVYCSKQCQVAAWRAGHKYTCRRPDGEDASAEHVEEVREALATSAAKQEFGPGGGEPEIRTDADTVAEQLRSQPKRKDAPPVQDLCVEPEEDEEGCQRLPKFATGEGQALHATQPSATPEVETNSAGVEELVPVDSDPVTSFELDPDFDYDHCKLTTPEFPYDQRPEWRGKF